MIPFGLGAGRRLAQVRSLGRGVLGICLLAPLAAGGPARAADPMGDAVRSVEEGIGAVADTARGLEQVLGPAGGRLTQAEAMSRFQESVYWYLIGSYQHAAEGFFVLVTTRSMEPLGLEVDADWYLAESLFGMGSYDVAESRYLAIARVNGHPFRADAVRRLLEIYSHDTDSSRFERLYQEEVASGDVTPDDLILYSVGKALYGRGETAKAKTYFGEIKPGTRFYMRARYFLGAMNVAAGDPASLDGATVIFRDLAAIEPVSPEDHHVHDLARLALARLDYERGAFDDAVVIYGSIGAESPLRADALHELAWTYIRQERLDLAVSAVDTFLAAYPGHPYAAELNLVRGHLLFETGSLSDAEAAYGKVVAEYSPVRDRFARLARSEDRAESYVKQVVAIEGGAATDAGEGALPAYALALLQTDPDLSRAIGLFRDLEQQDGSLDTSEALIQQLTVAIGSGKGDEEAMHALHVTAGAAIVDGLKRYVEMLRAESGWLRGAAEADVAGLIDQVDLAIDASGERLVELDSGMLAVRTELASVRADLRERDRRVAELKARLAGVEATIADEAESATPSELADLQRQKADIEVRIGQMSQVGALSTDAALVPLMAGAKVVEDRLDVAAKDLASLRTPGGIDIDMDPAVARFSRMRQSLHNALERLRGVEGMLSRGTDAHLYRVREVLQQETAAVAAERKDLGLRYTDAERVAGGLVRANFARLSEQFAASVLGADMGIVNVYWSQIVELGDDIDEVAAARASALSELQRRFQYLERKQRGKGAR
ncbi:MAG TPA: tetratricopeptide repeat protein [Myxococcota bacterium]|nr:tetratricopeptide repeat protein [Myxococcota bacterium]